MHLYDWTAAATPTESGIAQLVLSAPRVIANNNSGRKAAGTASGTGALPAATVIRPKSNCFSLEAHRGTHHNNRKAQSNVYCRDVA